MGAKDLRRITVTLKQVKKSPANEIIIIIIIIITIIIIPLRDFHTNIS